MITITKEFTKEQLQQIIETDHVQCGEASSLARTALASLEAEPVAYIRSAHNPDGFCFADGIHPTHRHQRLPLSTLQDGCYWKVTPLYTAPPAPVVDCVPLGDSPYDVPYSMPSNLRELIAEEIGILFSDDDAQSVWNVCRNAAMLQVAEPVTTAYKLPEGWVAVPVEPTAEMISSGIAAHYKRNQIQIHDRPAPGPMECAYVAMLAAAPQQEAKNV